MREEDLLGLLELAGQGERLRQPEAAQDERALLSAHAVAGARIVAVQERTVAQLGAHALDGALHARVVHVEKAVDRQHQQGGVHLVAAEGAHEVAPAGIQARLLDLAVDRARLALPARGLGVAAEQGCQAPAAIECHPAHQLGVQVVAHATARLPDAVVGLAPAGGRVVGQLAQVTPGAQGQTPAEALVQARRVEQRARRVQLHLVARAVADAHGPAAAVAVQVLQDRLGRDRLTVDRVEQSQAGAGVERIAHEVEELVCLARVADQVRRTDRHGRVAGPGVAVVPVALAADPLRERGRGGCHHGAGAAVDQQLEHQRRAQHVVPPGAVVLQLARPLAPEVARAAQLIKGAVGRHRLGPGTAPGEHEPGALAGAQPDHGAGSPLGPLLPRRAVADHGDQCVAGGAAREHAMLAALDHGPLRAVAEARVEDGLELHSALPAVDAPVHLVDRGARIVAPGHVVGQAHEALPGDAEQRLEHVGLRIVLLQALEARRGR